MFYDSKNIEGFVKGRIVELIFEMMMREDPNKTYTIIPFGYEKTTPELAQYRELIQNYEIIKVIRQSPDFILIKNDKTKVHFVEVKYRKHLNQYVKKDMAERSADVLRYWAETYFFLATQDGFYFDACERIVARNGEMDTIDQKIILPAIQNKYLHTMKKFIAVEIEKR